MAVDDETWTRNVGRLAEILTDAQWETDSPGVLEERGEAAIEVSGTLTGELLQALSAEPHNHDLRLRAAALLEALSDAPVRLIRRLAAEDTAVAALISDFNVPASAPDLPDALSVLASGQGEAGVAGVAGFDGGADKILDMAGQDAMACVAPLIALGPELVTVVTGGFEGAVPDLAAPSSATAGSERIVRVIARFREQLRVFLSQVTKITCAGLPADLAQAVNALVTSIRGVPTRDMVRNAVRALIDDASLHAAAASRVLDQRRVGQTVKAFERARRWVVPVAAIEKFVAKHGAPEADSTAVGALCGVQAGYVIWAARDHISSRQLASLPAVHSPSLL